MYEVELKVPADHDAVRDTLEELGAEYVDTVKQIDTYYNPPHRDFGETDEALRIRRESADGERVLLTYKGPLIDRASKTREEVETTLDDGDAAEEIFDRLGFEPVATVEKDRTTYALDGYTVTLDEVVGLGQFVEVEIAADDVQPAREGARDLLEELGFDSDEHVRTSYLGLLLAGGDESPPL